jgi:hypothetical protein
VRTEEHHKEEHQFTEKLNNSNISMEETYTQVEYKDFSDSPVDQQEEPGALSNGNGKTTSFFQRMLGERHEASEGVQPPPPLPAGFHLCRKLYHFSIGRCFEKHLPMCIDTLLLSALHLIPDRCGEVSHVSLRSYE